MDKNRLHNIRYILTALCCFISILAGGCGTITPTAPDQERFVLYEASAADPSLAARYAPIFLIEGNERSYNRIGTPSVKTDNSGEQQVYIDTERTTFYTLSQKFTTEKGTYTNLIYRIHFSKTPLPHITAGKNIGLLIYITLNEDHEPLLITTLHTCGCYLGFIATSDLDEQARTQQWQPAQQIVYGVTLPSVIPGRDADERLVIKIRRATHRVLDVRYATPDLLQNFKRTVAKLAPMSDLHNLASNSGATISFFETAGIRKGYVKGSRKRLEMLFMSWWAMDLFIGEDKALGPPDETGNVFYTSLKFWARNKSNIWYFPEFLKYWGWKL